LEYTIGQSVSSRCPVCFNILLVDPTLVLNTRRQMNGPQVFFHVAGPVLDVTPKPRFGDDVAKGCVVMAELFTCVLPDAVCRTHEKNKHIYLFIKLKFLKSHQSEVQRKWKAMTMVG